jgi:tryptophanyl-tRNA synthetase
MIPKTGARIMGLDDPARKMSKSKARPGQAIYLLDSPDDIRRKIMRARTDSRRSIRFDEDRPALRNLLTIYRLFSGLDRTEIENRFEGKGYADLKKELADLIIESLRPLQARYRDVTADPLVVESLLARGASAARPMAEKKIEAVKRIVGLG